MTENERCICDVCPINNDCPKSTPKPPILITIQGGVLHDVEGLPEGYVYRLIDWDEKNEYPEQICEKCRERMCPIRAEDIYYCEKCKHEMPLEI